MFINVESGGTSRESGQFAKGEFLLIATGPEALVQTRPEIRALILPKVHMKQIGQFMMANVEISEGAENLGTLTISGTFGGDGLPCDLAFKSGIQTEELWKKMHPIPPEIVEAFWQDSRIPVQFWGRTHRAELLRWATEAKGSEDGT